MALSQSLSYIQMGKKNHSIYHSNAKLKRVLSTQHGGTEARGSRVKRQELQICISGYEYLLLLQRTQVQLLVLTWQLTTIHKSSPSDLMPFAYFPVHQAHV